MSYNVGDPGHMKAHSDLVAAVNTEAARFGLAGDLPTRAEGDEGHLDDHNAIRAKLELIETTAGKAYGTPLPPVRNLGDGGHTDDHTALLACALEASLWPAWNDASGGDDVYTVNNYLGTGESWRVHEFLSSGSLTVNLAAQPFRVACIGGGSGGYDGLHYYGGGTAGAITENPAVTITAGAHTVTVGNGGSGGTNADGSGGASGPGAGGASSVAGVSAAGSRGKYSSGRFAAGQPARTTTYNGSSASAGHGGAGGGDCGNGSCAAGAGGKGIVIVAYQIG